MAEKDGIQPMKQSETFINGMYGLVLKGRITIGISWLVDLSLNLECLHYQISGLWSTGTVMILLKGTLNRK